MTTTAPRTVNVPAQVDRSQQPPVVSAPQGSAAGGLDLAGFLLAHRAFRREFSRLAAAATELGEASGPEQHSLEEQIAMMARVLHSHHTTEDDHIWPVLRQRDPVGAVVLDVLQREHAEVDPLVQTVTDRTVPLRCRAVVLERLSILLNRHLDREEAEAVPLLRRHFTYAEWEDAGKAHGKTMRKDLPAFVCTVIDHMTEAEVADLMATSPKILVVLYKLSWRRKWAKRRTLIYGA